MIIANFLYFIIIIFIYSAAPVASVQNDFQPQNLFMILLLLLFFWFFNKLHFSRIRDEYVNEQLTLAEAKKLFYRTLTINTLISIFLFSLEVFLFDYKKFIGKASFLNFSETLLLTTGLALFILHLAIIWFHGFKAMGEILELGRSPANFIWSHIKFNSAILIPYLAMLFILDLLTLTNIPLISGIQNSPIFQILLMFIVLLILAPPLITFFWDCDPLQDKDLTHAIQSYCSTQGIKFRQIMSWNALNKGLITAAVIGGFKFSRYLLITPGLLNILTKDEILAVVSHEVGHVKKKHLFYYFLFIVMFMLLAFQLIPYLFTLFFNSKLGFEIYLKMDYHNYETVQYVLYATLLIVSFILFFRFIFGYFMRNFERQADLYCFESGIDPNHLISSFHKLGEKIGESSKASNWHHFNIFERIAYIRQCIDNPQQISQHKKRMHTAILIFLAIALGFYLVFTQIQSEVNIDKLYAYAQKKMGDSNLDPKITKKLASIYTQKGMEYYNKKKWAEARQAYETSLKMNYQQPETLNNLAWLLLTCPDKKYLRPQKALQLAEDSVRLQPSQESLDTLAEAYYQNGMLEKAYRMAKKVLSIAKGNRRYYRKQFEKMKKAYLETKDTVKI